MSLLQTFPYSPLFCTLLFCPALLYGAIFFDELVLNTLARMRTNRLNRAQRERQLSRGVPLQPTRSF